MLISMKILPLLTLLFLMNHCTNKQLACGDVLENYAVKHPVMEFMECSKGNGQTILSATYRVSRNNVREVETFLVNTYGMGALKFSCCIWEPENGQWGNFRHPDLEKIDRYCSGTIAMHSDAIGIDGKTIVNRDAIPYFYVVVQIIVA